jgi:Family of unknown function (DUF6882)
VIYRQRILFGLVLITCAGCQPTKESPPTPPKKPAERATQSPPQTYDAYVARGREKLRLNTALQDRMFQINRAAWDVDQLAGVIRFQSPTGVIASAPVQIIGSFTAGTWTWAWANPLVNPKVARHAGQLRAYGTGHSVADLTAAKVMCDQQHCWDFVAADVAMNDDARGGFVGTAGDTMVFMTFGEVTLTNSP